MAEMSPLRRRMIEDMTIRNLSPATQRSYIHVLKKFSRHFGQSPDRLGLEQTRIYQLHLISRGIAWATLNQNVWSPCGSSMGSLSGARNYPSGFLTPVAPRQSRWS